MKFIALLFAILIVSSMGGIVNRKKSFGRTSVPEEISFQIIYLGTCNDFHTISRVTVSSISDGGCLPLNLTTFAPIDDLTADVLCTNIGRGRSQIDFVEVYNGTESNPYTGGYAISFVPNKPFRANSGQVSYLRRPTCTTQKDFCSTTNYVHTCTENPAVLRKGFVISNDEIFVISNHLSAVGCGQAINSCCAYLSGICPRTAPATLLKFDWDNHNSYDDHDDHHDNHHNDYKYGHGHGRPQQGNQHGNQYGNQHGNPHPNPPHGNPHPNPHHGNNNHDDDHDDDYKNNQHGPSNGHGNNNHGNNNHGNNNHGHNNHGHNNHGHKSEEDNNNNNHKIVFDEEDDDRKKKINIPL